MTSVAAKYRRVGDLTVRPVIFNDCAFWKAKKYYDKHSELSFSNDITDYLEHGFVLCRPDLFWMAKVIDYEGRRGWFVRFAIGNFLELLATLPCVLPFIAFCRDNDKDMRVIELSDFFMKAVALHRRNGHGRRQ